MRSAFTAAEFHQMITRLRADPPHPGESLCDLSRRLALGTSHSRPAPHVVMNILRAAGFYIRRRLTMKSRRLLRALRNLRRGQRIDFRDTRIEYTFHPKEGKDAQHPPR